jgi:3-oxoacyl-[acyl-carrier-protein] synthase-1
MANVSRDLAVTGIGMVSSLGLDVVTSCAAARAGLLRTVELDDVRAYDADAEAEVPVVAHQVPFLSAGLFGVGRLLQIALGALDDLRRGYTPPSDRPVGFVLALRSDQHRTAWLARLKKDPELAQTLAEDEMDLAQAESALASYRKRLTGGLLSQIVEHGHVPAAPAARRTIVSDQVGIIAAFEQAATWLADGTCDSCWVGGVDSYLDPPTLQALAGLGLLRTPDNPVGFMPGELGCFLALESAGRAARQGRKIWATIDGFGQVANASDRLGEASPPTPEPLVRAISELTLNRKSGAASAPRAGLLAVNLNGDVVRASEWGNVLVRLCAHGFDGHTPVWIPPLHFGEIGSATGPAAIAMLARGWARGYAPSDHALVCLMDDSTARGAFSVNAPS